MSELFAGKYLLKERLGVGGMAEVWLAELKGPQGFSRQLVIKRILPHLADDDNFITMFEDEARLAARLSHPHAVRRARPSTGGPSPRSPSSRSSR